MTRDDLELLTIAELAQLWRLSTRTIQRRIKTGEIPTVEILGQKRIRLSDVHRISRGEDAKIEPPTPINGGIP